MFQILAIQMTTCAASMLQQQGIEVILALIDSLYQDMCGRCRPRGAPAACAHMHDALRPRLAASCTCTSYNCPAHRRRLAELLIQCTLYEPAAADPVAKFDSNPPEPRYAAGRMHDIIESIQHHISPKSWSAVTMGF